MKYKRNTVIFAALALCAFAWAGAQAGERDFGDGTLPDHLALYDVDGDGVLSVEEIQAMKDARHNRHAEWLEQWVRDLKQTHKIDLESTTIKEGKGFQVIPFRWAVERTFAWLLNDRRHSRDYERLTANSAAMIQISMIRLLLNRLA